MGEGEVYEKNLKRNDVQTYIFSTIPLNSVEMEIHIIVPDIMPGEGMRCNRKKSPFDL
jgi:hypothetical protein